MLGQKQIISTFSLFVDMGLIDIPFCKKYLECAGNVWKTCKIHIVHIIMHEKFGKRIRNKRRELIRK